MTNRNTGIDEWKGFAIFLVVAGHVIAQFFDSWFDTLQNHPEAMYWWSVIYTFHMPLMFFISGYLFLSRKFETEPIVKIWLHKIRPLVLPFVFMGGVIFLAKGVKDSYWYLRTLFLFITLQIIYESVRRRFQLGVWSDFIWTGMTFFLVQYAFLFKRFGVIDMVFDIDHFSDNWIYFSVGVLFRRYQLFKSADQMKYVFELCFFAFAFYVVLSVGYGKHINKYLVIGFVLCAIVATYRLFNSTIKHRNFASPYLQYMGKHSLEIYMLSALTLFKLPEIGDFIINNCNKGLDDTRYLLTGLTVELTVAIALSIVVVVLCAIICEGLKSFPLIYKLFLGRTVE